jgi:hypothetical protein
MDNEINSHGSDVSAVLQKIQVEATSAIMLDEEPDVDLFEILTRRIVVPSPDADAIEQAMADIKKLVNERAGH